MKLQDMVISLETAKKLKQLGVQAAAYACYIGDENPDPKYNEPYELYTTETAYRECGASWYNARIPAYTALDLFGMIPATIYIKGTIDWLTWTVAKRDYDRVDVMVFKSDRETSIRCFGFTPFAESMARLLVWLLTENLIRLENLHPKAVG